MRRIERLQRWLCAAVLAVTLCGAQQAAAHPHVWVTVETEVVFDAQKAVTGFRHKWTFDEFYSAFAVQGLDANNDGKYDAGELKELTEINVQSLKEFDYFTFPKLAGKLLDRLPPKDYRLEYNDTKLTLYLTIPLKEPLPADKTRDLTLGIYDPTFYVDFALAEKDPVRLAGAPSGCAPSIREPDPKAGQADIAARSEADFNQLTPDNQDAEQFAKSISIACPAG